MTALQIYLVPGKVLLGLLAGVFGLPFEAREPVLFAIVAGFVSWMVWIMLIKAAWHATLRLLGFV